MSRMNRTLPLLTVGLAVLAACEDGTTPTEPLAPADSQASTSTAPLAQAPRRPHEEQLHRLNRDVPGFGGYFFDENGTLVAYLTKPGDQGRARAALASVLRGRTASDRSRGKAGDIVFREGKFEFVELSAWRDRMVDRVLDVSGAVYTDLDEARNRLVVGVTSAAARREAEKILADQAIPLDAVVFEETEPVQLAATLRDHNRPIEGGLQIAYSGGTCTLGFNAYWSGYRSFLTNSHCTDNIWQNNSTYIYQPNTSSSSYYIGYEIHDPGSWSCGWFGSRRCRYSDAAVIRTSWSVSANYGYVARTTGWAYGRSGVGSITINSSSPRMQITGESAYPAVGDILDKIGRTTGWTYGEVQKTCVDTDMADGRRVLCTDYVNMGVNFGDSGSPVFIWKGSTVVLAGILWGMNSESALISAMWNIEADLGALSTF